MRLRAIVLGSAFVLCGCDKGTEDAEPKKESKEAKADADAKKEDGASEGKADKPASDTKADDSKEEPTAVAGDCPEKIEGKIEADLVIGKDCVNVPVSGNVRVDGVTLTIEPGASLAFAPGAELSVGYYETAKLIVNGTAEAQVTFTTSGDKAAGVWKGVRLHSKAARSSISGLVVEYAGEAKEGGIYVDAEDVTIVDSTVRNCKEAGIVATKRASFASLERNRLTATDKVGMRMPASVVGGIGAGNELDEDARVHVQRGTVEEDVTWRAMGVPYLVVGEVRIDGKEGVRAQVKIEAGASFAFSGDARFAVGYYAEGALVAKGTTDAPITFEASTRKEAGEWRGIAVHSKGEVELENVTISHGGKKDREGALYLDNGSRGSLNAVTFDTNAVGVVMRGKDGEVKKFDNVTFKATPVAIELPPRLFGSLGPANVYEGSPRIAVTSGGVDVDSTWNPQKGAKVELTGKLSIDKAKVQLGAGFEAAVGDGVGIDVGYYDTGTLEAKGTAAAPVVLRGVREEAGSWKTLTFHTKARAIDLQNFRLEHASDPGIKFKKGAQGKVEAVTCKTCAGEAIVADDPASVEGVE